MVEIKVKYDQIVGWKHGQGNPGDPDYVPAGPDMRCYHFTFGKPGNPISGGFYIKLDAEIPEEIILRIPPIDGRIEQEKWREEHEIKRGGSDDAGSDGGALGDKRTGTEASKAQEGVSG